jgi:hypothetical protein
MNKNLILIAKSLAITTTISLVCSLCIFILWDKNVYATFGLTFILQYAIHSFIEDFLIKSKTIKLQEIELNKIEQLSTILSCASCNANNLMTFIPDDNSRFEFSCEECKGRNVVNINFTVARTTEALPNQK